MTLVILPTPCRRCRGTCYERDLEGDTSCLYCGEPTERPRPPLALVKGDGEMRFNHRRPGMDRATKAGA